MPGGRSADRHRSPPRLQVGGTDIRALVRGGWIELQGVSLSTRGSRSTATPAAVTAVTLPQLVLPSP